MIIMNKVVLALTGICCLGLSQTSLASASQETTPEAIVTQTTNKSLNHIVAVINNNVITERELQQRVHSVALNLRRQKIELPEMNLLREQVLERLITEKVITQRANELGIRVDDQMVNLAVEQIAKQNKISVTQLHQQLLADGMSLGDFRRQLKTEIMTQRLRERDVDSKITISETEIDTYLADKAGFSTNNTQEYLIAHILLPINDEQQAQSVEDLAQDLLARAQKGEDFQNLSPPTLKQRMP